MVDSKEATEMMTEAIEGEDRAREVLMYVPVLCPTAQTLTNTSDDTKIAEATETVIGTNIAQETAP